MNGSTRLLNGKSVVAFEAVDGLAAYVTFPDIVDPHQTPLVGRYQQFTSDFRQSVKFEVPYRLSGI
jgi:hypothetical protein